MTKNPGTLPGFFVSIDKRSVSIDKRYLHVGTIWELHLFR